MVLVSDFLYLNYKILSFCFQRSRGYILQWSRVHYECVQVSSDICTSPIGGKDPPSRETTPPASQLRVIFSVLMFFNVNLCFSHVYTPPLPQHLFITPKFQIPRNNPVWVKREKRGRLCNLCICAIFLILCTERPVKLEIYIMSLFKLKDLLTLCSAALSETRVNLNHLEILLQMLTPQNAYNICSG